MRALKALASAWVGAWAASCSAPLDVRPSCTTDAECGAPLVCFIDGCGDPGRDIVVEVVANTRASYYAQDFVLDGRLGANVDVSLFEPLAISGELLREPEGGMGVAAHFVSPVTLRASGQSALLPGIARTYEGFFAAPERGVVSLFVGAGTYTVTATPKDSRIPPVTLNAIAVKPGQPAPISVSFPSDDSTVALTGRLSQSVTAGPPLVDVPMTVAMDVQAFNPATLQPLSQKTAVAFGKLLDVAVGLGDFTLKLAPEASKLESVLVAATPQDPSELAPSRTFVLRRPLPAFVRLEFGTWGPAQRNVTGQVLDSNNAPVVRATVYIDGVLSNGATFKTRRVSTDDAGLYTVDSLATDPTDRLSITVLPPQSSTAGILRTSIAPAALRTHGSDGGLAYSFAPHTIVCPDKVAVEGRLLTPNGESAAGVAVVINPIDALAGRPLPTGLLSTVTDVAGRFAVELDPAVYQIDFQPGSDLPLKSRRITVQADIAADGGGGLKTIQLSPTTLSLGRRTRGKVLLPSGDPAANATLKFYRVSPVEGRPSSVLLGEALTDSLGSYAVTLPTR